MPKPVEFISFLDSHPRLSYREIWEFQKARVEEVSRGEAPEAFVFCEHERVITLGRRAKAENILFKDIPSYSIERGGDVTYHGPDQLVIYPILKLNGEVFSKGLHEYLRFCEQVLIDTIEECRKKFPRTSIAEVGRFGPTGVWIRRKTGELKKIASIGVAVRKWVTYHGMALNVDPDLQDFQKIRPCDFEASIMTSIANEGIAMNLPEVYSVFTRVLEAWLKNKTAVSKSKTAA